VALTAEREFTSAHTVEALVRVYQAEKKPLLPVALRSTITDQAGQEVWMHAEDVIPGRFDARHAADVRITLPLSTLTPGEYLLRVEAASVDRRVEAANVRFSRR